MALAACSGGGGGNNNSNSGNGNTSVAPRTLSASILTLSPSGQPNRQIVFSDNTNWSETQDTTTVQGTYVYTPNADGRNATLDLNANGADQLVSLTFVNTQSGGFNYTSGTIGQGTFTLAQNQTPPGDGGGTNNPPPATGNAPSTIAGKTMFGTRTFTSTGPSGQTHTYTFTANTFHDSDAPEESDGSYTYQPNSDDANLELSYTGPANFQGDKHHIQMHFDTTSRGTFTSTYDRRDGTVIQINGTFEFE
jgi:hypothetical protein